MGLSILQGTNPELRGHLNGSVAVADLEEIELTIKSIQRTWMHHSDEVFLDEEQNVLRYRFSEEETLAMNKNGITCQLYMRTKSGDVFGTNEVPVTIKEKINKRKV